ncbi:MAG: purine-binding chemotaxis protein CheW [Syntrophaceae bacterium]|nr:MAG: purine-binding chemotaxis protein CheW [Syntrophaceae bacterium]
MTQPDKTAQITAKDPEAPDAVRQILEERARLLARTTEKKEDRKETLEVQAFHLGTEYLGVPTAMVQEIQILRVHRWSRVPCAPPFIVGVVNLRGRIYSIMDLAAYWGLPARPVSENSHILLVKGVNRSNNKEIELTLITDDCSEVQLITVDELRPPPSTISAKVQGYLRGVTQDMMLMIDLESLLADPDIVVSEGE